MLKLFPPGISLQELFFPRNQSAGFFFPEISHTLPLKSQMVGPLRRNVHPPVHPFHFQVSPFSYINLTTRGFSFCIAQFVMAGFGKFQVETSVCLMSVRIEKINTWVSLLQ